MAFKNSYSISLVLLFFLSCGDHAINTHAPARRSDTIRVITDTITNNTDSIPLQVAHFRQSTCQKDCRDAERLFSIQLKGDSLFGRLGITHYCNQKMKMNATCSNDTLRLTIDPPGTTYTDKNGKTYAMQTITFCYCYYNFDFGIKHISNIPGVILVNDKRITKTQYDGAHALKKEEPVEEPPASDTIR